MQANSSFIPVVLAGGSGSRLWPLSRELHPKQFLTLPGHSQSMLQATLSRVSGLSDVAPLVICNEVHRFTVAEQLRQVGKLAGNILLEPSGRNTAPAIALAALAANQNGVDPVLLVLAADHLITDVAAFEAAIEVALPFADDGKLVVFGVMPTAPETGYGYIKRGNRIADGAFSVSAFVEKPNLETAESYIASGMYDWNSGMFLFKASVYLSELKLYSPEILEACTMAFNSRRSDYDFIRVDAGAFAQSPSNSIDYAVMEKTTQAVVVPMSAGWSDIGAFSSLWEISDKDSNDNFFRGDVIACGARGSFVDAENALVAVLGVEDLVVVQTKDAVLVAARDCVQDVKKIVEQLKADGRSEYKTHRQVYRPWGHYDAVDAGPRYQVKRITVAPGAKLSLQMHHHRAEHWVVVSGAARVVLDGVERLLVENESIYLPIGAVHSLENPGRIPLELIEVQVGAYLGEDDIVRFEDRYGRVEEKS